MMSKQSEVKSVYIRKDYWEESKGIWFADLELNNGDLYISWLSYRKTKKGLIAELKSILPHITPSKGISTGRDGDIIGY